MRAEIEDLKTGWYDISVGLKKKDIEAIVEKLKALLNKEPSQHFHLSSDYKTEGGVSNIEIYLDDENSPDNLSLSDFVKE